MYPVLVWLSKFYMYLISYYYFPPVAILAQGKIPQHKQKMAMRRMKKAAKKAGSKKKAMRRMKKRKAPCQKLIVMSVYPPL